MFPLIMPLALLSLVLIAVHVSVLVDCKPTPHNLDPQSSLTNAAHAQTTAARRHSQLRASMRRSSEQPDFLVILPEKTHSSNCVSIFDLRTKMFLCMDPKGALYNSRHRDTEDCLFHRIWLWTNNHYVFYSTRATRLLKLQGVELNASMWGSSELPTVQPHRFLSLSAKRQKRSVEVNPSDPLRSETHHSHPARNHQETEQPKRDQAGAVSKETITSCDDPLKVLQTNEPGSPVKTNIGDQA